MKVWPLPHQIPKDPGGISLRFAMVHDVLHERYARHGPAYYRERNRQARQEVEEMRAKGVPEKGPRDRYFALLDDLGVGLDSLGDHDEAAAVLHDKLRRQEAAGLRGRDLYTTYANLGTFLIHGNVGAAEHGDTAARDRLREGLGVIEKAIAVNPQAHFGREVWQAVAVEFLLAALDDPSLLLRYDMIGDCLDRVVDPDSRRCYYPARWTPSQRSRAQSYLAHPSGKTPTELREAITRVGAEEGWVSAVKGSLREPTAFDEPVLGIIGMWRLGGGANPHFALALGEIMLRIGQRYIAWCAYERALRMADRFWPDPAIVRRFVQHCRSRQVLIESQLPREERDRLKTTFDAELANGLLYQAAYQRYEAERIAADAPLDDPHFYDAFRSAYGPIATPSGKEEQYLAKPNLEVSFSLPSVLLFAGAFALATALFLRRWAVRRQSLSAPPKPQSG